MERIFTVMVKYIALEKVYIDWISVMSLSSSVSLGKLLVLSSLQF